MSGPGSTYWEPAASRRFSTTRVLGNIQRPLDILRGCENMQHLLRTSNRTWPSWAGSAVMFATIARGRTSRPCLPRETFAVRFSPSLVRFRGWSITCPNVLVLFPTLEIIPLAPWSVRSLLRARALFGRRDRVRFFGIRRNFASALGNLLIFRNSSSSLISERIKHFLVSRPRILRVVQFPGLHQNSTGNWGLSVVSHRSVR
jgi:hypothetical protein